MNSLALNILGQKVLIQSNNNDLIRRVGLDFSHFIINNFDEFNLRIKVILEDKISVQILLWSEIRCSKNSITFERGNVRYNDYYGKLIFIYNYGNQSVELFSSCIEKFHEITYLLILS